MKQPTTLGARVVIAMSGGVDSAVAAALLVEQGFEVIGITMHLSQLEEAGITRRGTCCSIEDVYDARRIAEQLSIPHYVANYEEAFKEAVIDRFVDDYQRGRTPSPCIPCNDVLKFDLLRRRAMGLGAELLATGHYSRVVEAQGGRHLYRARHLEKDQSYFLFGLSAEALETLLLPVGELTKDEVRAVGRRLGLAVADKPESQDICFVPDGDYAAFVERRATPIPGQVVDGSGRVLGQHGGIHRFTIGQRRGLGLGGGEKRYVTQIDAASGRVTVGGLDGLRAIGLEADRCSWLGSSPPQPGTRVLCRIRHRSAPKPAVVQSAGTELSVRFDEPVSAVAPGQAAVLYDVAVPDRVLGGGWIDRALPQPQEVDP